MTIGPIPFGEHRPITELYPAELCGCGRKVRYVTVKGDATDDACNKYGRCMSYDELQQKYNDLLGTCGRMFEELEADAAADSQTTLDTLRTFGLTEQETEVVQELSDRQELSAVQVVRQALRLYQSHVLGHTICTPTDPPVGCPEVD